ncbi:MAG: hypothetical protein Q4F06_08580 [Eubacteriales bacterium]|nr:hypothetical protein [Eubacteriales bacterium]
MLSEVLSKETCAECRFCCSFRRCSLWETPLFPEDECEKLSSDNEYGVISDFNMNKSEDVEYYTHEGKCVMNGQTYGQMKLSGKYKTDDSQEEASCDYLSPEKGCILSDEDKPFDCKIWPLRIMKKGERLVIAHTPTCPALGKEPNEKLIALVKNGLGKSIFDYAILHPFIVKEYKEGFPVIMECGKE